MYQSIIYLIAHQGERDVIDDDSKVDISRTLKFRREMAIVMANSAREPPEATSCSSAKSWVKSESGSDSYSSTSMYLFRNMGMPPRLKLPVGPVSLHVQPGDVNSAASCHPTAPMSEHHLDES